MLGGWDCKVQPLRNLALGRKDRVPKKTKKTISKRKNGDPKPLVPVGVGIFLTHFAIYQRNSPWRCHGSSKILKDQGPLRPAPLRSWLCFATPQAPQALILPRSSTPWLVARLIESDLVPKLSWISEAGEGESFGRCLDVFCDGFFVLLFFCFDVV